MVIKKKVEKGVLFNWETTSISTKYSTKEEISHFFSELAESTNSKNTLKKYISMAEDILEEDYGVKSEWLEILEYKPTDQVSRDSREVVIYSHSTIVHMENNNAVDAVYCALRAEEACNRLLIQQLGPNVMLGKSRRESNKVFAKRRGKELHEEREKYWAPVRKEAENIAVAKPHIANNKSELARRVKKTLNLKDPVDTIRRKI